MGPSRQQSSQLADGKILNWQCSNLADCQLEQSQAQHKHESTSHRRCHPAPAPAMAVNTNFNTVHDRRLFILRVMLQ